MKPAHILAILPVSPLTDRVRFPAVDFAAFSGHDGCQQVRSGRFFWNSAIPFDFVGLINFFIDGPLRRNFMLRLTSLLLFGLLALGSGNISAPIPPTEVASFDLIVADLELKVNSLTELLAEEEKFETQQEKIVRAGGVIACLSQAAIEHDDFAQAKFAAPALRDAAIELQSAEDHAAAVAVAQTIKQAWQGVSTGEHAKEHEWSELVSMYDLMEEMNDRNGGLSRSLRRSRGKVEEQLNASTNAVLAIAMLADHNYVSEEADAKEWDQLSKDYQQAMTSLIKAIQEKDQAKIGEFYKAGNRACDTCHEKFRD